VVLSYSPNQLQLALVIWTRAKTISCHSYSKIWTEILFFNKMGYPRTSIARLLPTSIAWWLLGLDVVERWLGHHDRLIKHPWTFLCEDMLKTNFCSISSCKFGRTMGTITEAVATIVADMIHRS